MYNLLCVSGDVTDRKLQLAGFEWNLFLDEEKFDENLAAVVTKMKAYLAKSDDNMAQIFGMKVLSGNM